MSYEDFAKIKSLKLPKIKSLKAKNKEVLYFGTYHSNTKSDSIFSTIKENFKEFRPDYILHEGGNNWPVFKDIDSTILVSGEAGYIIQLAQNSGISYSSIEPMEKKEYQFLLSKYKLEWVVLMYMCRQIDNQQRLALAYETSQLQFEQNMNYFFRKLAKEGMPINETQQEFSYWKNVYSVLLKEELDWRTFNPDLYYPNKYLTQLNEVNRSSDKYRNLYMIQKILNSTEKYNRVMVLVGGGHLVIQERLLEYKFKKKYTDKPL